MESGKNSPYFFFEAQAKKKQAKKKSKKNISKKDAGNDGFESPIEISGDEICRKNTKQALKLLFEKDEDGFQAAVSNLGKIECAASGSGVYVWEKPVRFKVGAATYNAGPVWFASVLVHESRHSAQYKAEKKYSGKEAELECLEAQIDTLKKIGAGQSTIDYVQKISQSEYWLVNENQRWW